MCMYTDVSKYCMPIEHRIGVSKVHLSCHWLEVC